MSTSASLASLLASYQKLLDEKLVSESEHRKLREAALSAECDRAKRAASPHSGTDEETARRNDYYYRMSLRMDAPYLETFFIADADLRQIDNAVSKPVEHEKEIRALYEDGGRQNALPPDMELVAGIILNAPTITQGAHNLLEIMFRRDTSLFRALHNWAVYKKMSTSDQHYFGQFVDRLPFCLFPGISMMATNYMRLKTYKAYQKSGHGTAPGFTTLPPGLWSPDASGFGSTRMDNPLSRPIPDVHVPPLDDDRDRGVHPEPCPSSQTYPLVPAETFQTFSPSVSRKKQHGPAKNEKAQPHAPPET